jgi:hypothetical protein
MFTKGDKVFLCFLAAFILLWPLLIIWMMAVMK